MRYRGGRSRGRCLGDWRVVPREPGAAPQRTPLPPRRPRNAPSRCHRLSPFTETSRTDYSQILFLKLQIYKENYSCKLFIPNIRVNKDQRAGIVCIVVTVNIWYNAIFIYININRLRSDMNSHGLQDRQYLGSVGNMDGGRWRPSADDPGGHGPPRLAPRRLAETSHFTFLQGTVQRRKP